MATELTKLNDACSIREAALKISIKRERLFEICKAAKILIPWGGSKKRPRYKVRLRDAEDAILSLQQGRDYPVVRKLNPSVKC